MSIIYSLIAREDDQLEYGNNIHVLVEVSESSGNFPQVTREIILKNVPSNQFSIYEYNNRYVFHTLHEDHFVYLCLTDMNYSRIRAYQFLEEVKEAFKLKFSFDQRIQAIAYGMNNGFSSTLTKKMDYFNEYRGDPKLEKLKEEVRGIMNIQAYNVEELMKRGQKIELLVKKAETLNIESSNLKQRATQWKEKTRSGYFKKGLLVVGSVATVAYYFLFSG